MPISEKAIHYAMLFILVIAGLLVFIFLLDSLTGSKLGRALACGILFWIPFGALTVAFTQACAAIPV